MAHSYNTQPEFWREVTDEEFAHAFFQYLFKPQESRQMFYDTEDKKLPSPVHQVRLFEIAYHGWEGLGVAIACIDKEIRFFKYGDPDRWKDNFNRFAAQFAGDNS